ncbi:MAG TPA: class I SAM-dependent methyltransferase [Blastocatellia bacterium]|nr:class I SAM-dependent methyltransferase [Blastocatellia bacterium]
MPDLVTGIAKAYLGLLPARPSEEYFHPDQISEAAALARARAEFEDERQGGFSRLFQESCEGAGGIILDLGCGFGGRTVEFQRRTAGYVLGLEIDSKVGRFAKKFAESMGVADIDFVTGVGESLPFAADSIDLIFSYDVFEHVQSPEMCFRECFRVLKPGGTLMSVFPPYFHPTGAHLEGYVSRMPYSNLIFPSPVLVRAIEEILEERGDSFRPHPLRQGDKLHSLNGLTIRRFNRIVRDTGFEAVSIRLLPLFSEANRNYRTWRMQYYAWAFKLLPRMPVVRECFTHRVVSVLRKPGRGAQEVSGRIDSEEVLINRRG